MTSRWSKVLPPTPDESPATPYLSLPKLEPQGLAAGSSSRESRRRSKGPGLVPQQTDRAPMQMPTPRLILTEIPELAERHVEAPTPTKSKGMPRAVRFNLGDIGRRVSATVAGSGLIRSSSIGSQKSGTGTAPKQPKQPKPPKLQMPAPVYIDPIAQLHAGPGGIFEPDFEHPVLPAFLRAPKYARSGYWDASGNWVENSPSTSASETATTVSDTSPAPARIPLPGTASTSANTNGNANASSSGPSTSTAAGPSNRPPDNTATGHEKAFFINPL